MAQLTNTVLNGKLVVNGNIYGNLIGNASTATSAANAVSLNGKAESALSVSYATTASSATNATLANSATSIATTAATSTSTYVLLGVVSSTAAQTPVRTGIEIIGTNINACTYTLNVGTIKGNYEVEGAVEQATYAVSAGYAGYALKLNNGSSDFAVGSSFRPVYFINGVPVATSTTLEVSITGNAATATQAVSLGTNAGSTTLPVYFSGGKPVATSTTLDVSITGKASTAGTADIGNTVKKTATSSNSTYYIPFVSGSTSAASTSLYVGNSKAFTFNPSTGVVSAPTFSGTLVGNASTATYATSLKVQNYTTSPGYLLAAVSATGTSLPIYANTNIIYYPSISTLKTPSISVNNIIHNDSTELTIGNSLNEQYVRFIEDTVFDQGVEINGSFTVGDNPVVTDASAFSHKIKVLTSTEFAAISDKSTDIIYFITP